MTEQAMPRLTGPTHAGSHVVARPGNWSQRHTASTRNGTKRASVPPLAKGPTNMPVNKSKGASHRKYRGTMQKTSTTVTNQAPRSTQSLSMWFSPKAMKGACSKNEPAG